MLLLVCNIYGRGLNINVIFIGQISVKFTKFKHYIGQFDYLSSFILIIFSLPYNLLTLAVNEYLKV